MNGQNKAFKAMVEDRPGIFMHLKKIYPKIKKGQKDGILVICGAEQSGKSELMLRLIYSLEPKVTADNICFFGKDYRKKISELEKSIIVMDEAGTSLFSREAMGEEARKIIKKLMVCGYRHLLHILILPDYLSLDNKVRHQAERDRLIGIIRIVNYGKFVTYARNKVMLINKQNSFGQVKPSSRGYFTFSNTEPGFIELRKAYRKKERKYKDNYMTEDIKEEKVPIKKEKELAIRFHKENGLTYKRIAELLNVTRQTVSKWCKDEVKSKTN